MGKQARFWGSSRIEVVAYPEPIPGPGEVRVRTAFCAACGSDNRLLRNGATVVPGHEISGVVDAVGPGAPESLVGRAGVVYIALHCGSCGPCLEGWTNQCERLAGLVGWQRDGGYQTHLTVPVQNFWPLPADIGLAEAPLLLDTLGTTGHAISRAREVLHDGGDSGALVLGFGPLGVGSAVVLRDAGVADVAVFDPNPERAALANALGCRPFSGVAGDEHFGLVVEASGNHLARQLALESVASRGVVVLLGESDTPWSIAPKVTVRRKDFAVMRSFYFPLGRLAEAAGVLRRRRQDLAVLVAQQRPLLALQETLGEFAAGRLLKPLTYVEE